MHEKKIWGSVDHLFGDDEVGISKLRTDAGFRCSIHYHNHRNNNFMVVSGEIYVWECDLYLFPIEERTRPKLHSTLLCADESITVNTGIPHWFEVVESGCVVEVYSSDGTGPVQLDDIVRMDTGGRTELRSEIQRQDLADQIWEWKQATYRGKDE